jgi:acetyl-CoA synthetase
VAWSAAASSDCCISDHLAVDLSRLLAPRSIAVIGASDRPDSYGGNVLQNLQRAGYAGDVWGVNPKRADCEVWGWPCVPTIADLPGPVDAVVIAIPAPAVPDALQAAAGAGCGGAVVLSAGFGEIEAGRELERELREIALASDLPVCGPNGNGIISVAARAAMWGDSVRELDPGGVALISQSGNVAVNALGSRRGLRWHTVVSGGNQAVCSASDWLAALAELDGVRSVAMFLESDDDGAKLAEALAAAAERGIGVAVLKVGESEAGAQAAAAHTGALVGDQRVFRALIEEAGGAWARDPHELLELARVLAEPRARPRSEGGLAVLTCSGGDSGIAADEAARLDIELPRLAPQTRAKLEELLPAEATIGNPLDYTALIWGDTERLAAIVQAVGDDFGIDQLVIAYDHPHGLAPDAEATWAAVRAGIVAGAESTEAAIIVASTLPDLIDEPAIEELAERGVPVVAGIATALRCAHELRRPPGDPVRVREIAAAARAAGARTGDGWLAEAEAKAVLRDAGIAVAPGRVAADPDDAVRAAEEIGWPVVLKVSAPGLLHKTGAGAIALGLGDGDSVREAAERLLSLPVADDGHLLVERMEPRVAELFISVRADGIVPALAIGLGGVWAEALDRVVIVPLPADPRRVRAALAGLTGAEIQETGVRGLPFDIRSVAALASRVGRVALGQDLALLELNPVAAGPDGCVVLDAVARRGS